MKREMDPNFIPLSAAVFLMFASDFMEGRKYISLDDAVVISNINIGLLLIAMVAFYFDLADLAVKNDYLSVSGSKFLSRLTSIVLIAALGIALGAQISRMFG